MPYLAVESVTDTTAKVYVADLDGTYGHLRRYEVYMNGDYSTTMYDTYTGSTISPIVRYSELSPDTNYTIVIRMYNKESGVVLPYVTGSFTTDSPPITYYTVSTSAGSYVNSTSGGGTYEEGERATVSANLGSYTGYDTYFNYWTENGSIVSYSNPYSFYVYDNTYLTANAYRSVWTYTVSYSANGGSGAPSSQTKTYGETLYLSSVKPIRTGYNFLGWSTSSSATVAAYAPGGAFTSNSTTTLYAVWKSANMFIYYGVGGQWKEADFYYGKDGSWKLSNSGYGYGNVWKLDDNVIT